MVTTDEQELLQEIDRRDEAEQFASDVYFAVTNRSPEWSNMFGYMHAYDDIKDEVACRKRIKTAARSLMARRDFWDSVESKPAEYDDLMEALGMEQQG